jgi:hypothetical protein
MTIQLPLLSMGTAWANSLSYPGYYVGGIETESKHHALYLREPIHVYAGLAILNPSARSQNRPILEERDGIV